ncbi:MAG: ABC transporter permease [Gemmatimonadota bacterium]|nr:MAG: ABC transporter permease [Gemmatimonadota bacterium]
MTLRGGSKLGIDRQVLTIYAHELRSAFRERNIVIYSIVLPVVMYPLLLWAIFAGIQFVQGQTDRLESRVVLVGLPEVHRALADSLEEKDGVELVPWEDSQDAAVSAIAAGRLDVLVEFAAPDSNGVALPNNFTVRLYYNEARDRSSGARARVEEVLTDYRDAWLDRERKDLGVSDTAWDDFGIVLKNVASPDEVVRFLLALIIPTLMIITVALAAFYPAVDATAGERERSTWETMMTVAASRATVATAKYLYVATFGTVGGLLNLVALGLSLRWILAPLGGSTEELASAGIPLSAFPVIALGTALLALFVAAIMLVLAAFARTFKEGQSMITPFYILLILPSMFMQDPDMEFSMLLASIPVLNIILLIREAIMGVYHMPQIAVTFLSQILFVAASIGFAQWVLRNEGVYMGTHEGGLGSFLKGWFSSRASSS